MVTVRGLSKSYEGKLRLSVEHFSAQQGQITAIVGPSAAGKSTLLRLIAGLDKADTGEIHIFGQPEANLAQHSTMVMQHPLAFRGTVLFNAMLAARLLGEWREGARAQALTALAQLGLADSQHQDASKLSGGQLMRLSLARALVKNPPIFLLDEATANLDPTNIIIIESVLQTLAAQGKTIIIVTHNLNQAKRLSHTIAMIYDAKLICQEPNPAIFQQPPSKLVHDFLHGEMVF